MKKIFLILTILILTGSRGYSEVATYSENKLFGLKSDSGEIITKAEYKKLIRIGDKGIWLAQRKHKFGLMNSEGSWVVEPKYSQAERVFIKYVKLKNFKGWGLYDENGETIIENEYSSIDPLFGKMFLTKKDYRYGIINYEGKKLLGNEFEDIYMPDPKTLRIKYDGEWFEIARAEDGQFNLSDEVGKITIDNKDFTITHLINDTYVASGYSLVTTTDYTLKILSSISPAYEETIDELMLSQGAEVISILTKFSWLPKFPYTFAKNYYKNIRNPYNGPLNNIKSNLKQKM